MPLLLTLDPNKKYDVIFSFDPEKQAWQIRFEERPDEPQDKPKRKRGGAQ